MTDKPAAAIHEILEQLPLINEKLKRIDPNEKLGNKKYVKILKTLLEENLTTTLDETPNQSEIAFQILSDLPEHTLAIAEKATDLTNLYTQIAKNVLDLNAAGARDEDPEIIKSIFEAFPNYEDTYSTDMERRRALLTSLNWKDELSRKILFNNMFRASDYNTWSITYLIDHSHPEHMAYYLDDEAKIKLNQAIIAETKAEKTKDAEHLPAYIMYLCAYNLDRNPDDATKCLGYYGKDKTYAALKVLNHLDATIATTPDDQAAYKAGLKSFRMDVLAQQALCSFNSIASADRQQNSFEQIHSYYKNKGNLLSEEWFAVARVANTNIKAQRTIEIAEATRTSLPEQLEIDQLG